LPSVREGVCVVGRSDQRADLVGGAAFSRCGGYPCSYRKKPPTLFSDLGSGGRSYEHRLNLVFIPHWGALGASWATVISYTFTAILMYLAFQPSGDRLGRPLYCGAAVCCDACDYICSPLLARTFCSQVPCGYRVVRCGRLAHRDGAQTGDRSPERNDTQDIERSASRDGRRRRTVKVKRHRTCARWKIGKLQTGY